MGSLFSQPENNNQNKNTVNCTSAPTGTPLNAMKNNKESLVNKINNMVAKQNQLEREVKGLTNTTVEQKRQHDLLQEKVESHDSTIINHGKKIQKHDAMLAENQKIMTGLTKYTETVSSILLELNASKGKTDELIAENQRMIKQIFNNGNDKQTRNDYRLDNTQTSSDSNDSASSEKSSVGGIKILSHEEPAPVPAMIKSNNVNKNI